MCLKKVHYNPQSGKKTHCDEWEFTVSDGKVALELLKELGFNDITPIHKTRTIYNADVYEIVIDIVEGLGVFMEIELKDTSTNTDLALKKIHSFIRSMGISNYKEKNRGYTTMAWNPFGKKINING